jgi:hypothetical protein
MVDTLRIEGNGTAIISGWATVGRARGPAIRASGESRVVIQGGDIRGTIELSERSTMEIRGISARREDLSVSGAGSAAIHVHGDHLDLQDLGLSTRRELILVGSVKDESFAINVNLQDSATLHLHDEARSERIITATWFNAQSRRLEIESAMQVAPAGKGLAVTPSTAPPRHLMYPLALLVITALASTGIGPRSPRGWLGRIPRRVLVLLCITAVAIGVLFWISRPFPEVFRTRIASFPAPTRWLLTTAAFIGLALLVITIWRRKLSVLLTGVCLVFLTLTLTLWVRSYRHHDQISFDTTTRLPGELHGNALLRTTVLRSSAGGLGAFSSTRLVTDNDHDDARATRWAWEDMEVCPDFPWTASMYWGAGGRARRWGFGFERHTYRAPSVNLATSRVAAVVPYWALSSPFAIVPALAVLKLSRQRRRRAKNLCVTCGYDLRASRDRCPECGTPIRSRTAAEASSVLVSLPG